MYRESAIFRHFPDKNHPPMYPLPSHRSHSGNNQSFSSCIQPVAPYFVRISIIPLTSKLYPTGRHASVFFQIIPCISKSQPANRHTSVRIQIIPLTSKLYPAGCHASVSIQIIPCIIQFQPACRHASVRCKIIPLSAQLQPSQTLHICIRSHIIPFPTV